MKQKIEEIRNLNQKINANEHVIMDLRNYESRCGELEIKISHQQRANEEL